MSTMRVMLRHAFVAIGLSLASRPALAGNVQVATIVGVSATSYATGNGAVPFFVFVNQNDANLGCNSGALGAFAIDASTPAGKAMIAVVLSAQATGRQVTIYGTGTCSVWGLAETASSISTN